MAVGSAAGRWIWLRDKLLNEPFGFVVSAFADMLITNITLFVDEIARWPKTLLVSAPGGAVIVQGDGIGDPQLFRRLEDIVEIFLVNELRIVHADDRKVLSFIFLIPFPDPGNHPPAVNSTEGPELQQHHFSA